ncbi:unnamed protein product [Closterium sp. NIES-54]
MLWRKKERETPESSVKVCEASVGAVPERADSPAPGAADSPVLGAADALAPRAAASMPGSGGTYSAGTNTPRPPTPSVSLTKLLGRRGLTGTRLLLALATTKASTLHGSTSTSSTATFAASSAPSAATEDPTPTTTPTSTATPSASSTASTAAPIVPSTLLAPLALAVAATPTTSRRSIDCRTNEVDTSSRSNRGE